MRKNFHLSRGGRHWLFSLLAGFLLIFVSFFGISARAISLMETEKMETAEKIADTVQRSMDHYLSALQDSASELMLNNQNLALQYAGSAEEFTSSATYRYTELMHNICMANGLVEDIYLYYPAFDYVVGAEGSYHSRGYYLLSHELEGEEYEGWKAHVLESGETDFFFYTPEGEEEQKLYFRRQMPGGRAENMASLIICVDGTEFARILDMALPRDGSTSIAVYGEHSGLYQTGTDSVIPPEQEDELFQEASGLETGSIRSQDYVGWGVPSEYNAFCYMVVSDRKALLSPIMPIKYLLMAGIAVCTAAGLLLSLFLSIRNHRPIERALNRLEDTQGGASMDYQEFEKRINELILDKENYSRLNERMLWTSKGNILTDILNQRLMDVVAIQSLFQTVGITLDYVYYCVILADVSGEKNRQELRQGLIGPGQLLEQEFQSVDVIPALIGDTAVFLLNYDAFDFAPAKRLMELLREQYGEAVVLKSSEIFMSVEQLAPIYEQLLFHLREELGGTSRSEEDVEEVKDKEGETLLERWKKALFLREYSNAGDMTEELFEKYVKGTPDTYICMCRQHVLIYETLQCAKKEDERYHSDVYMRYLPVFRKGVKVWEIPEILKDVLEELEEVNSRYAATQKDKLDYKIKKIIDSNYNQHYLGLSYISEQVNVSASYVSKVFKEEYGIGVVEYMNRLRINRAKELMETENLTVKEIAEKVGFTSDIHFIRIFKKYENTTPGVYRKQGRE